MKNLRTLAAVAASVVISGALIVGVGLPANAATNTNFPPHPIVPGPSVPPIPPGTVFRPVVQFPTCANTFSSTGFMWLTHFTPGFHFIGTSTTAIGTSVPELASIAASDRHQTCVFGTDASHPYYVTTVALTAGQYTTLFNDYDYALSYRYGFSEGHANYPAGAPGSTDWFFLGAYNGVGGTREYALLSPDGWWITVSDHGNNVHPETMQDGLSQFLAANPGRS